jgi:transposase-like protein
MGKAKRTSKAIKKELKSIDYGVKPATLKAQAVALNELGYNFAKTAKILHVNRNTVSRWVKEANENELDIEIATFNKLKEIAKYKIMTDDIELQDLSKKKLKKELKDKDKQHKLSDITDIYKMARDPYIEKSETTSGNNNLQVNIKTSKDEFSIDM